MNRSFAYLLTCTMLAASITVACQKKDQKRARHVVGDHITQLRVGVGSIWGNGYNVVVFPEEYALVETANCPNAKRSGVPGDDADGLCVVRIDKKQSKQFEAAMQPYKRYSVPAQTISFDDDWTRPDGKPCKRKWTDATLISLAWTGTEGVRVATFYTGCDQEELGRFYDSVLKVTDLLPIQQYIQE